jgi:Leucine-rich repeat (LRR) protein
MGVDPGQAFTEEEAAAKTEPFFCQNSWITDITGIEYFPNLIHFDCSGNFISRMDLSNNTKLIVLRCGPNEPLHELILPKIDTLKIFGCTWTNLVHLDLSNIPALEKATFTENRLLESVDFSNCSNLTTITGFGNTVLSTLDITGCTKLEQVELYLNNIKNLDISHCENLININVFGNDLETFILGNNPKLYSMDCGRNKIQSLDLTRLSNLHWLRCIENQLTTLDVTNQNFIHTVLCDSNEIENAFIARTRLFC